MRIWRVGCARLLLTVREVPHAIGSALLLSLSRSTTVEGFRLIDTTEEPSASAREKLKDALHVIESNHPRALESLRRNVKRFVLVKAGGPEYWPSVDAVVLSKATFLELSAEMSALTLVHEGMHARLRRLGVGYHKHSRRRIEEVCVRAEVQLARKLPDAATLERVAVEKLSREWWTETAIKERRKRARSQV